MHASHAGVRSLCEAWCDDQCIKSVVWKENPLRSIISWGLWEPKKKSPTYRRRNEDSRNRYGLMSCSRIMCLCVLRTEIAVVYTRNKTGNIFRLNGQYASWRFQQNTSHHRNDCKLPHQKIDTIIGNLFGGKKNEQHLGLIVVYQLVIGGKLSFIQTNPSWVYSL